MISRSIWTKSLLGVLCIWIGLAAVPASAETAADREKLLTDPGVYGTFALFSLGDTWTKQDQAIRISQLILFKGVVEQHREKVAIDLYLLRGLSDQADLMFRIHATELHDTQRFLMDLQNSAFGKFLKGAGLMHGMTKQPVYVRGFPDQLKADLKVSVETGPRPYAIVIPVRKTADWWALDQDKRTAMMQEHTEAALPYLKTVKRKLYHSSGLDDLDFITYFETTKLEDFHNLILSLERIQEFHYVRRFGHPTLVGAAKSVDELIEELAQ